MTFSCNHSDSVKSRIVISSLSQVLMERVFLYLLLCWCCPAHIWTWWVLRQNRDQNISGWKRNRPAWPAKKFCACVCETEWNIPVCFAACAGRVQSVSSAVVTCCWWREPSLWPPGCLHPGPVGGSVRRSPAGSTPPSHETVSPAEQPIMHRQQLYKHNSCFYYNGFNSYIKIWLDTV